jgi:hypothetical protein
VKDKNIKIKVQSKISLGTTVVFSVVILVVVLGPFLLVYLDDPSRFGFKGLAISSLCVVGMLIGYIWPILKEGADNTKYVSDLIITPYSLQIIYKLKNKIEEVKEVSLQDVKSVKMVLYAEVKMEVQSARSPGKGRIIRYYTETVIILKNNEVISFKTLPLSTGHTTNIYKYLIDVLKVKHVFSDFS